MSRSAGDSPTSAVTYLSWSLRAFRVARPTVPHTSPNPGLFFPPNRHRPPPPDAWRSSGALRVRLGGPVIAVGERAHEVDELRGLRHGEVHAEQAEVDDERLDAARAGVQQAAGV